MSRLGPEVWRSALFAPANRGELVNKLPRSCPDVVVLDLEDAVREADKADARRQAIDAIRALDHLVAAGETALRIAVRINGLRTPHFADDCAALASVAGSELRHPLTVVLPKAESPADLDAVAVAFAAAGAPAPPSVAGLETARGVGDARRVLSGDWVACYFGAEDFITDLGGVRTASNDEITVFRSMVALEARLAGVVALDVVCTDYTNDERFNAEVGQARALGYAGKLCIHPGQVPLANAGFGPDEAEVDHARRVLDAWEAASASSRGAIAVDGQLIDEPMVSRARTVIRTGELRGQSA